MLWARVCAWVALPGKSVLAMSLSTAAPRGWSVRRLRGSTVRPRLDGCSAARPVLQWALCPDCWQSRASRMLALRGHFVHTPDKDSAAAICGAGHGSRERLQLWPAGGQTRSRMTLTLISGGSSVGIGLRAPAVIARHARPSVGRPGDGWSGARNTPSNRPDKRGSLMRVERAGETRPKRRAAAAPTRPTGPGRAPLTADRALRQGGAGRGRGMVGGLPPLVAMLRLVSHSANDRATALFVR